MSQKPLPIFTLIGMGCLCISLMGCASPEPSSQPTAPPQTEATTTAPSTESAAVTPQPEAAPTAAPQASFSVADIVGQWTSEGDVNVDATHLTLIEIVDYEGEISGTIEATSFEDGSRSGVLSLVGRPGESVVDIYDQRGHYVGTAELTLNVEVLVFKLIDGETEFESSAEQILPAIAYHTRV